MLILHLTGTVLSPVCADKEQVLYETYMKYESTFFCSQREEGSVVSIFFEKETLKADLRLKKPQFQKKGMGHDVKYW